MTYRPRASAIDNPQSLFKWNYEQVSFNSTDGIPLSAWWIPAPHGESMSTVILCPGGDKASQLSLVKRLRPAGYNVLVFDFRGNGDSGGQLCSYGDLERRDVLGAMRWLRQAHPRACRKVTGIGVSIGGAALIAAAADPSPEGQNIDAIAVYETYDRLDREVGVMVDQFVPLPFSWFVKHVGLPLAGVQVGADLTSFAPAGADQSDLASTGAGDPTALKTKLSRSLKVSRCTIPRCNRKKTSGSKTAATPNQSAATPPPGRCGNALTPPIG